MREELLQERKKAIYGLICDELYVPMKAKEIAAVLNVPKSDRRDLAEVLDALVAEGKVEVSSKGKYMKSEGKFLTGVFAAHPRGFGFVTVEGEDEDIFIPESQVNGAFHGDTVQVALTRAEGHGRRREGQITKILTRGVSRIVCTYEKSKTFGFAVPDNPRFGQDIFIPQERSKGAVSGHKVVVELIAADFNEYVANEPKISFRNGKYYVVDGQHTIEARILRNGGRALPILCKVYTGMTMQQEALLFAEQNGHSAPLSAGIKLRAKVAGDDAPSKEFLAATNRVGLAFNYDSLQLSDYRISCVGTALKLYNQMGEKIYCEALRLIVDAWEGKPDSFRAAVLKGVMYFVEVYHGEFNEERLIRALRSVHPMEIYRTGMDNPAKLPGWKKYVFPIYMAYNGKGRKDALPMKF